MSSFHNNGFSNEELVFAPPQNSNYYLADELQKNTGYAMTDYAYVKNSDVNHNGPMTYADNYDYQLPTDDLYTLNPSLGYSVDVDILSHGSPGFANSPIGASGGYCIPGQHI